MVRVGAFDLDIETGELRRDGELVPLRPQPTRLLLLLVRNAGRLVEREEIRSTVWSGSVVEFDQGINACVRQIRNVLGDSAAAPSYIETVPRRGYRLVAPVTDAGAPPVAAPPPHREPVAPATPPGPGVGWIGTAMGKRRWRALLMLVLLLVVGGSALWLARRGASRAHAVAVVPLPGTFADVRHAGLPDTLAARIAEAIRGRTEREIDLVPWTGASRFDAQEGAVLTGGLRTATDYVVSVTADQRGAQVIVVAEIQGARASLPIWRRDYRSPLASIDSLTRAIGAEVAEAIHAPALWPDP